MAKRFLAALYFAKSFGLEIKHISRRAINFKGFVGECKECYKRSLFADLDISSYYEELRDFAEHLERRLKP